MGQLRPGEVVQPDCPRCADSANLPPHAAGCVYSTLEKAGAELVRIQRAWRDVFGATPQLVSEVRVSLVLDRLHEVELEP